MRIRVWLTGLIVFLLVPSLLFASLWFKNSFNNVSDLDQSLDAVALVQELGPLYEERALTGRLAKIPPHFEHRITGALTGESRRTALEHYRAFIGSEDTPKSLHHARDLARTIVQSANLSSHVSFEASRLPFLVGDTLLTVVIESAKMVQNGTYLSTKKEINVWDKMLLPVQGGQFKIAADSVAWDAANYINKLHKEGAPALRDKALRFRTSNTDFQSKGSALLSSTISARTGSNVQSAPVAAAFPELTYASFELWHCALDYIRLDLLRQRSATLLSVILAGATGFLVIATAFGIAFVISRALARRNEQEIENLGFHDPLTGLPNRRALLKSLKGLAETPSKRYAGLIHVDLRHFKKINNQLGNEIGDEVLRDIAHQLNSLAGPKDFIARTGGTEFCILRPSFSEPEKLEEYSQRILSALSAERTLAGRSVTTDACIGLSLVEPGRYPCDQMIIDAALALRAAKHKGAGTICRFTQEMRTRFEENGETARKLMTALKSGDIVPWFQPQICTKTGLIVGAETLVRWIDDDKVIYPGAFLPAAIEAGYMDEIDGAVRKKAMQMAATLGAAPIGAFHLGLNISASLLADREAVDELYHEVLEAGLEPHQISLEILESVMIDEATAGPIRENVARLSDLGFFIELDDFGTGHSSISSLRDLKIDRVKIDRSFISGVDADPDLQKFTSALIRLAKSLDIGVLAEGVETEGERDWLTRNECDVIQGFLFSQAVPEETFISMAIGKVVMRPTSPVLFTAAEKRA